MIVPFFSTPQSQWFIPILTGLSWGVPSLAPSQCQHLLRRQLAEKWPTTPHVQHFRGLVRTGATLPLTSSRMTQRRFPGSLLSWWVVTANWSVQYLFYGFLPPYATELCSCICHWSYSWVPETWGPFPNRLDNPETCAYVPHTRPYRSGVGLWNLYRRSHSRLFGSASDSQLSSFGSHARAWSFFFTILVPLGSLAILPLILSHRAASMAAARVLRPSICTSPRSYLSLNASIYALASNACIGPLF